MILVGDVRVLLLDDGRMELSSSVCAFGLFLCSSSPCNMYCLFVLLVSLFLYFLCVSLFAWVGLFMRMVCSMCCFLIIRLTAGLHHDFLGGFGIFSYDYTTVVIASCVLSYCWSHMGWFIRSSVLWFV
jgi:hypothetical protein